MRDLRGAAARWRKTTILLGLLALFIGGCRNPLYWVWPSRKLFVSVPTSRRIFELDRSGLRSTWGQIGLDSGPTRLAWARKRNALYAILPEVKALVEISPDTYMVQATITTGGKPSDLAISTDEAWAYTLNPEEYSVVRIDLRTHRVERTISFTESGFVPAALGAHPSKPDDIYVASASGSISIVRDGIKGATVSTGGTGKVARVVPGRKEDMFVVDGAGATLFRISGPDAPKVETFDVGYLGGSAAVGTDGTVYVTAPSGNKLVRLGTDRARDPYAVGGQVPRAVVADDSAVFVANEGSNQVVAMLVKAGKLYEPQVVDSLPGPPVDMVAVGD